MWRYSTTLMITEMFHQFLLFERIAVRGLANHFELVFDPLERRILLNYLVAQLELLRLQLG